MLSIKKTKLYRGDGDGNEGLLVNYIASMLLIV